MALKAARRRRLPASSFAYPRQRKYPIDTVARARNALSRAAQSGTSGTYRHVAEAVRRRWGNRVATVGRKRGTVARPGYRRQAGPARRARGRKVSTIRSTRGRRVSSARGKRR